MEWLRLAIKCQRNKFLFVLVIRLKLYRKTQLELLRELNAEAIAEKEVHRKGSERERSKKGQAKIGEVSHFAITSTASLS